MKMFDFVGLMLCIFAFTIPLFAQGIGHSKSEVMLIFAFSILCSVIGVCMGVIYMNENK